MMPEARVHKQAPPGRGDRPMAGKVSDHLANERTFLAWVRTSLGLIGLGFVLARMGLFLRQFALAATAGSPAGLKLAHTAHAGREFLITGVVFLVIGTMICAWAGRLYNRN